MVNLPDNENEINTNNSNINDSNSNEDNNIIFDISRIPSQEKFSKLHPEIFSKYSDFEDLNEDILKERIKSAYKVLLDRRKNAQKKYNMDLNSLKKKLKETTNTALENNIKNEINNLGKFQYLIKKSDIDQQIDIKISDFLDGAIVKKVRKR